LYRHQIKSTSQIIVESISQYTKMLKKPINNDPPFRKGEKVIISSDKKCDYHGSKISHPAVGFIVGYDPNVYYLVEVKIGNNNFLFNESFLKRSTT
jgi:hypothetical protein